MHQSWGAQTTNSRWPQPIDQPRLPSSLRSAILTNSFPHQGYVVTQPALNPLATQPSQYRNNNYQILMMNSEDINLQTHSYQYDNFPDTSTTDSQPKSSTEPLSSPNGTLQIPRLKVKVHPKITKGPLHRNVGSSKATHTYSIIYDLVQSPTSMSMLEVLQTFPFQWKAILWIHLMIV